MCAMSISSSVECTARFYRINVGDKYHIILPTETWEINEHSVLCILNFVITVFQRTAHCSRTTAKCIRPITREPALSSSSFLIGDTSISDWHQRSEKPERLLPEGCIARGVRWLVIGQARRGKAASRGPPRVLWVGRADRRRARVQEVDVPDHHDVLTVCRNPITDHSAIKFHVVTHWTVRDKSRTIHPHCRFWRWATNWWLHVTPRVKPKANHMGYAKRPERIRTTSFYKSACWLLKHYRLMDAWIMHLLFCHPALSVVLAKLFQLMMICSYVPDGFRYSYIVPLPKPKERFSKSLLCDDFRGIAISSVLSKVNTVSWIGLRIIL